MKRRLSVAGVVGSGLVLLLMLYPIAGFAIHGSGSPGLIANVIATFNRTGVLRGMAVSALLVGIGATISTAMSLLAAFGASNTRPRLRTVFSILVAVPFFVRGGIVPFYMVVRGVGLSGTFAAMIVPILGSPFMVLLLTQFFQRQQYRLLMDAGRIDGTGEFRLLATIICPAAPWIVSLALIMAALEYWNSWIPAFLFVNEAAWYPFQIVFREMAAYGRNTLDLGQATAGVSASIIAAAGLIALIPSAVVAFIVASRPETITKLRSNR